MKEAALHIFYLWKCKKGRVEEPERGMETDVGGMNLA